jgi:hypothetical protein
MIQDNFKKKIYDNVGMVDTSYMDGTRLDICIAFLEDLKKFNINTIVQEKIIIREEDFTLNPFILKTVRENFPELEVCLLFWTKFSIYKETNDKYEISYPVIDDIDDNTDKYEVSKETFNLFLFCDMFTMNPKKEVYMRMKIARISVPYIVSPPPSIVSIVNDGQMKILTDFIETVQDIGFVDGDKILIVGSSAEGGYCAGKSYNVLSYMTKQKIDMYLYDPEDIETEYTIGSVTYHHYRKKYNYDGSESQFKVIFDDAWTGDLERVWDENNCYALAKYYSIKWFPFYDNKYRLKKSFIKNQVYYTKGSEQRCVSHEVKVAFKRCDYIGSCPKCVWFKYILHKDYGIEFYDYIMKMHDVNCVTKERRTFDKSVILDVDYQWYEVEVIDKLFNNWFTVSWDPVKGLPVMYPSDTNIKGRNIAFTNKNFVRPDIYQLSNVCVIESDGKHFVNRENIENFIYKKNVETDLVVDFVYNVGTSEDRIDKKIEKDLKKKNCPLYKAKKNTYENYRKNLEKRRLYEERKLKKFDKQLKNKGMAYVQSKKTYKVVDNYSDKDES